MNTNFYNDIRKDDMYRKNHIDNRYRMEMTPEMLKMFHDSVEGSQPGQKDALNTIKYQSILPDQIQTRTISEREYKQLKPYQTRTVLRIPYGRLAIILAFVIVLGICLFNNLNALTTSEIALMGVLVGGMALVFIGMIVSTFRMTVRKDSQIAEGTVIFFNEEHTHRSEHVRDRYYVTVALHNQEAYIKRVICSVKEYRSMQMDGKVFVVIKGSKVFAIAAKEH